MNATSAVKAALPVLDAALAPLAFLAAALLHGVRRAGVQRMPLCRAALHAARCFPINEHYYEPLFRTDRLRTPLDRERELPGIEWNEEEQLAMLASFHYQEELRRIPRGKRDEREFRLGNGSFDEADAQYLYCLLRLLKPRQMVEIGAGQSTLIALLATAANRREDAGYRCQHSCVEPYEAPWLEDTGVAVIRRRVEELEPALFQRLERNDVLFIDSSHVIRPQGDVLFEYLRLLPLLSPGVVVLVHDIFTPRDYPASWLIDQMRFWNEQYLLEAFLTHNRCWRVVGALSYLHHRHFGALADALPGIPAGHEPGSFYLRRMA